METPVAKITPECRPVKQERERRWLEANRDAVAAYNEWIDANGVPLSEFRQF